MKSEKAKVLHSLLGRPLFAYSLRRALGAGADPAVAVVGHQAEKVTEAIHAEFPGQPILIALQGEQKGTGHAVQCARAELGSHQGPVLILYGDVPLLRAETLELLRAAFEKSGRRLALVTSIAPNPTGYGRVLRKGGRVQRIVEEKDCSAAQRKIQEVNAGIYWVDSRFLWSSLERLTSANAQGELYLTDLVQMAAKKGRVGAVTADFAEITGVNDRAELARCARAMRLQINERHMRAGVTLEDPETTFIAEDVELGADCELGPMVSLTRCRIGPRVRIGQGSILTNAAVGEGTEIRPYSVIEDARIGNHCQIGPFARLRPGTELAESVHIGNFVETKKARLGKGSKANHLTYLGDAVIGERVNVGAGTITCNYDGSQKFQTVLGNDVFIGSDTQLVAPVEVGDGAYVGAGTTVTKNVPPMSLALSRGPQVNKEGWVAKKKAGLTPVKKSGS